jgi:hypothetical protein
VYSSHAQTYGQRRRKKKKKEAEEERKKKNLVNQVVLSVY